MPKPNMSSPGRVGIGVVLLATCGSSVQCRLGHGTIAGTRTKTFCSISAQLSGDVFFKTAPSLSGIAAKLNHPLTSCPFSATKQPQAHLRF